MSGPVPFPRRMQALDQMLAASPSWDDLEKAFKPAGVADHFEPDDQIKKWLAAFFQTEPGRALFEWIADLTVRAPYPHVGNSRDSAWLAAKAHEARAAVGLAILRGIADGEKLLSPPKEPTHETSA
ncbi:MAG: hypothetical protein ABTQ31_17150 [Rhizobiaceae bacterium]